MKIALRTRNLIENARVLTLTTTGWILFKTGTLLKSTPRKSSRDPLESTLSEMKTFMGAVMLGHRTRYQVIKREAMAHNQFCPSEEEYDAHVQLPAVFEIGHEPDLNEIARICDDLDLNTAIIFPLIRRNPSIVINYLRLEYWNKRFQLETSS